MEEVPEKLKGIARFGMAVERRLGVAVPDMRKIAKESERWTLKPLAGFPQTPSGVSRENGSKKA